MAWVPPSKLRVSSESNLSIPVSKCDADILELSPSGCENRQILEVLTGLIALRLWSKFWQGQRAKLAIRGDNVGALVLFSKLKSKSSKLTLIARDFSLDLGNAEYRPGLVQHVPGISNQVCDVPSRNLRHLCCLCGWVRQLSEPHQSATTPGGERCSLLNACCRLGHKRLRRAAARRREGSNFW